MVPGRCARWVPLAAVIVAGATACGGGSGAPQDASPDTPIDMAPGTCGADATFTGEIVDWDSTETRFCGVFGAKFTVRGDATRTSSTAPNGRFLLCLAHQAQTLVDIVPPTAGSECPGLSGTPMNTYQLQGVAIATDAVIAVSGPYSARAMIESRVVSMEAQISAQLSGTAGELVVHVGGTPRAVSISAAHGATQRFDGTSWAAGDTGADVWFPNVVLGATPVSISVAGGAIGAGDYTLEPGKLTYVTVIAN